MKKLIMFMAAALMVFGMQSCKEKPQLSWAGEVTCQADGLVEGTFPTGTFAFNGNGVASVTTTSPEKFATGDVYDLAAARQSNDSDLATAAEEVNAFFVITKAEGKYHVHYSGYVAYGPFKFRVEDDLPKTEPTVQVDTTAVN